MSSVVIGLIACVCVFGGAMLGLLLRKILPQHHLSGDSKDAIRIGSGLLATLSALILGLLVSSAKNSFDTMNEALAQSGAKIILLDRTMAHYGPETKETRDLLRRILITGVERFWPEDKAGKAARLKDFEMGPVGIEVVRDKLRQLTPQNSSQQVFQSQALQLCGELLQLRWLTIEQTQTSLPTAFLVVLLFWLSVLFITIGLFAPSNATVITVLLVCAMSVGGAIFLIEALNRPFEGIMKVSSAPLIKALEHVGK